MPVWLSLVLVVVFLAMNAFFVVAEFACVRVRKSQIDLAFEQGKPGSKNAKIIAENINAYLSACQLGITLASLALGWLGEPAFAALISPLFDLAGMGAGASVAVAAALGYAIMTTLHVVAGELIPKSLAIFSTEAYALATATPLLWFYRITYPIMWLFNSITNAFVRLLGHDPSQEHEAYTDEEIMLMIDESTESGLIEASQNEYVDNIFDLGDKDAEAIMTPRMDLVCIDLQDSLEENLSMALQYKYTRYPVCDGSKDRIVGFVHVKDLFTLPKGATMGDLPIRPIEAVPESVPVAKLLTTLQEGHTKIAVVVDEHGGTAGIVTLSDVFEQFVGRVEDEFTHDAAEVERQKDGTYLVEGSLADSELEELLGFLPEEAEECETVGGLMMVLLDRIPDEGDATDITGPKGERVFFQVVEMDRRRVGKVQVRIELPQAEEGEE